MIHDDKIKELELTANQVRQDIVSMLIEAKSGHTAGPLGFTDVFVALYFSVLKHDSKNPDWEERDRFFLSHGHIAPGLYATLANAGYFPREELRTLRKFGTRLQGHPHRGTLPGIESSSGPLGQGLSQAIGSALALKLDKNKNQIYCAMGDGELNEGQIWEAMMFAGKNKLDNLTAIIDRNNIQIDGMTEDVMPLEPLADKFRAFNWHVLEVDGHNIGQIVSACEEARAIYEKPVVIIAHTIAGKGIDSIEFDYKWHGVPPKPDQGKDFLNELRTLGGRIKSEHE